MCGVRTLRPHRVPERCGSPGGDLVACVDFAPFLAAEAAARQWPLKRPGTCPRGAPVILGESSIPHRFGDIEPSNTALGAFSARPDLTSLQRQPAEPRRDRG